MMLTRKGKLQETGGRKTTGAKVSVEACYASQLPKGGHGRMKKNALMTAGALVAIALVQCPWV